MSQEERLLECIKAQRTQIEILQRTLIDVLALYACARPKEGLELQNAMAPLLGG